MPVAVIDVGSNTVRLLVTRNGREILSRREMLRLGSAVEQFGRIPAEKLAETMSVVASFADAARTGEGRPTPIPNGGLVFRPLRLPADAIVGA